MFTRSGDGTLNCEVCGASINAMFPTEPRARLHEQWHFAHEHRTEPVDNPAEGDK